MSNIHLLSPTPASSTIEEADVSINRLCSILTSAVIENEIDNDGHIFTTDGLECPVWIDVDEDRKLVHFFSYYPFDEDWQKGLPASKVLDAINTVSTTHILVQFFWDDRRVCGAYWMTYDARLDPRHFIKMLRRFSGAFVSGVDRIQTLLRP
jgi:hypothetical protein